MRIVTNQPKALKEAAREKRIGKSIGILAIAAALIAGSSVISVTFVKNILKIGVLSRFAGLVRGLNLGVLYGATWGTVFVGGLFLGFVVQQLMTTLGGKGSYFEGLTSLAYPLLPASIGAIIGSAVSYIPYAGPVIAFCVLAIFIAIGYAGIYRAFRELFDVDMITALVGVIVLTGVLIVAISGGIGAVGPTIV